MTSEPWSERAQAYVESDAHREGEDLDLLVEWAAGGRTALDVATGGGHVARRLREHEHHSLGVRGAYLHVLSDLLGSVGAVVAGVVIFLTGWTPIDAIASTAIAGLVLFRAFGLVREAVDVLMEAVPPHVDVESLRRGLERVPGTCEVHDLHVWTLTTGRYALSAHAVVSGTVRDGGVPALRVVPASRGKISVAMKGRALGGIGDLPSGMER